MKQSICSVSGNYHFTYFNYRALYSINVISRELMDEVQMIALSPVQKKMKLLSAVGEILQVEP